MRAVFLSASVPDAARDPKYHRTGDVVLIREAVEALVELVLPRGLIVWGGHPAISPFVRRVAERSGRQDHVETWQSELFRGRQPLDTQAMIQVNWVPAAGGRQASLKALRAKMLGAHAFAAGVFIGGMEGVEEECRVFRKRLPRAPVFPIGSTGAAARILWAKYPNGDDVIQDRLAHDLVYDLLFEDLLGPLLQ